MFFARLLLLPFLLGLALPSQAQGGDPRNMSECVQMLRSPLESQCRSIFAGPGQQEQRNACLEASGPQIEAVCRQFFGENSDFCATCTSSCSRAYVAGDPKRRECLTMCLRQPGCA